MGLRVIRTKLAESEGGQDMPSFDDGSSTIDASRAGTFSLGEELTVNRLGFGAMRLTGNGIWGEPRDPQEARRVLRRALDLGVNLIDTADSYGPEVSERLIAQALHPYPDGLVIATKGGFQRPGPNRWVEDGRPEQLREAVEGSLRRLRVERIDLYQLHRVDPKVPAEDQFATLAELREQGKIRHVGLSEVRIDQIEKAREFVPVVSVQNRYNLTDRGSEDVLDYSQREGLGFLPWFPLAVGRLTTAGGALMDSAKRHDATPAQVALAWLLKRSSVMLPIPGTSSVSHLEQNVAAAELELDDDEFDAIGLI
jgi:pyridoxine 4-dehydrogenase